MKQETNNEIELLLRRLGRQPELSVPGADLSLDADHLDADELSAYAENALPAPARARYTEHIADCSRCRELVVGLSSSVGVVKAAEAVKPVAPSALRKFLAGLFSPMVLRYSIPALGVLVVMAIGFQVMRTDRSARSVVVQLSEADQQKAATSPPPEASSGFLGDSTVGKPASLPENKGNKGEATGVAAPPPNTPPAVSVDAEVKPARGLPAMERQAVAANEPPPPKVAATPTPHDTKTVEVEAGKQTIDNRTVANLPVQEPRELSAAKTQARAQTGSVAEFGAAKKREAAPVARPSSGRAEAVRDGVDKDAKEDEAETRSVAGRRFRKQRGIWIDTAYEASRSAMNVSRGSEQFRALVADEPAIKTIADQLDGEIVVVWKGHVYRIR